MSATLLIVHGEKLSASEINDNQTLRVGCSSSDDVVLEDHQLDGAEFSVLYKGSSWMLTQIKPCADDRFNHGNLKETYLYNANEAVSISKDEAAFEFKFWLIKADTQHCIDISLPEGRVITIGRAVGNDIRLDYRYVARTQGTLSFDGGNVVLTDTGSQGNGSTNGTFVNGKNIRGKSFYLCDGDEIRIGKFLFIYRSEKLEIFGDPNAIEVNDDLRPDNGKADVVDEVLSESVVDHPNAVPGGFIIFTPDVHVLKPLPTNVIEIEEAPNLGGKPEINIVSLLFSSLGMFAIILVVSMVAGMASSTPMFPGTYGLMFGVSAIFGAVASVINYSSQKKKYFRKQNLRKEKYVSYLNSKDDEIAELEKQQKAITIKENPSPSECLRIAGDQTKNLWVRQINDAWDDFMKLRVGIYSAPPSFEIKIPRTKDVTIQEDEFYREPQKLLDRHSAINEYPCLADIRKYTKLGIAGIRSASLDTARCLIVEAAAAHSYKNLKIVVVFPENELDQWAWARWLPHCRDEDTGRRYIVSSHSDADDVLNLVNARIKERDQKENESSLVKGAAKVPYWLFVVAAPELLSGNPVESLISSNNPDDNIGTIIIAGSRGQFSSQINLILTINGPKGTLQSTDAAVNCENITIDHLGIYYAEAFARSLAPIRLPEGAKKSGLPSRITFMEGYHITRPESLDLEDYWANANTDISMAVPVGIRENGELFNFDILSHAEGGSGPHGLIAGITGSGKSQMVQSWILSMAVNFSPQQVSFVLVDFKGSGLLTPFMDLPHVAGMISPLDKGNISRNLTALRSEILRRENLMKEAKVDKIKGYHKKRGKDSLPQLFIVIDEYAEFKKQYPDWNELVESFVAVGLSLGIHIVLMTQHPAGVLTGKIESLLSFRWCLKVASPSESKDILGNHTDAAYITNPGRAFIRVGTDEIYEQVQSLYSDAPYDPYSSKNKNRPSISRVGVSGIRTPLGTMHEAQGENRKSDISEINALVSYIRDYVRRKNIPDAVKIWLPKLPGKILLSEILSICEEPQKESLTAVCGMLDNPSEQMQYPFSVDIPDYGNVAVIGAPGTGKTTFLQSFTLSLCERYSPDELNFYVLDYGGFNFSMFRDFPQCGDISTEREEEKTERILELLRRTIDERKTKFLNADAGNLVTYRAVTGEPLPYVLLVIDNYGLLKNQDTEVETKLKRIAQEGGSYGLYIVLTCSTLNEFGYRLLPLFGRPVALRQNDPSDYQNITGGHRGVIPENLSGRGLINQNGDLLEFQTALPAEGANSAERAKAIRQRGKELSELWGGKKADTIAVMPDEISFGSVKKPDDRLALGLSVQEVKPVSASLHSPHVLLISASSDDVRNDAVDMLLDQLQGSECIVFSKSKLRNGAGARKTGADLDEFLSDLAKALQERYDEKESDSNRTYPQTYLFINDMKDFSDEMTHESADRLKALIEIGAGLGVSLVIADRASSFGILGGFSQLSFFKDMARAQCLLVGGKLREHSIIAVEDVREAGSAQLEPDEAYYGCGGTYTRIKLMKGRET